MHWPELLWRACLQFIFHTAPADVFIIGAFAFALWSVAAIIYVALFSPPRCTLDFNVSPVFPRKLFIPAAVAVVLLAALVLPAVAAEPTQVIGPVILVGTDVAAVPADLDTYLNPLLVKLGQYQTSYYDQRGAFAQSLPVFSNAPTDGVAALPDRLTDTPTSGVPGSTIWLAGELSAFPANVRIDVYDGPQGKGYTVSFEARFNGTLWRRTVNSGPESYRQANWLPVAEGAP